MLRSRVEAALAANEADLYQYSRDELVRLGAFLRLREGVSLVADDGKLRPEIEMIQLGAKWQGGVEGLRHVRRIRPAKGLYLIAGVDLPSEAVAKFEAESQIKVQTRGRAQLGIHNNSLLPGIRGVAIFEVEPGGAAAKGGILSEDVIVEFNGVGIATFEELVKQIEVTEPGQTVPVKVVRAKETVELQITMGSWAP